MKRFRFTFVFFALVASVAWGQEGDRKDRPGTVQRMLVPRELIPDAPVLSPTEALKSFTLPPGYSIGLAANEPLVQTPVALEFDADGRIWVVEMIGYMPNVEGTGEDAEVGNIVILEDTDGDGVMDKRTVFADGLVMPRAIGLVAGGALVAEPPNLFFLQDTDGDGKADSKEVVDDSYGRQGNPEHTANGLLWAIDNWIYSANHNKRYRYNGGKWITERTRSRGQWGIAQDDYGRLYFNSNSDQLRTDLIPSQYLDRNPNHRAGAGLNFQTAASQEVWPARINPGVNRGYQRGTLRQGDWRLARYTGASGPGIYRGNLLPEEVRGYAFVPEPTGNFVRMNKFTEHEGVVSVSNAFYQSEFLASTDERFRPVNIYNGPDGALYIVDMYRGLLQHRIFLTTYLREQIEERGLENPLDYGRIYRVTHQSGVGGTFPKLSKAPSERLVLQLEHANGWWRDTAQRLLVERQDTTVIPQLQALVVNGRSPLARLHALWTLEGMNAIDSKVVISAVSDWHPKVRMAGIRMAERLGSEEAKLDVLPRLITLKSDTAFEVRWQLLLTLGEYKTETAMAAMRDIVADSLGNDFMKDSLISGLYGRELEFIGMLARSDAWKSESNGAKSIYGALAGCLLSEGNPEKLNALFRMVASIDYEQSWIGRALLENVTPRPARRNAKPKPLQFSSEPGPLVDLASGVAYQEVAQALLDLTVWPGKVGTVEAEKDVLLTEEEQARFDAGKEFYAITCGACHQLHGNGLDGLAPPLLNSEWVNGSVGRLTRIVLNGLSGPITVTGREYNMIMPGLPVLDDDQIANLLTYIRNEWGHSAGAVTPAEIAKIRAAVGDRADMWTAEELLAIP